MMRLLIIPCVPLCALLVLGACSKEGEPPPQFNEVLAQGSQELPPVPLARPDSEDLPSVTPARYLKKIAGPAGNPADVAIEKPGAKAAEPARAIVLNDAEAETLMKQFVELSNAGNFEATVAMFVQDQQPALQKVTLPMTLLARNLARLRDALKDTAPDVAKQFQPDERGMIVLKAEDGTEMPLSIPERVELVGVTPQGDDKAVATVRTGAQGSEKKFEMERVDGKWRIRDPGLPSSSEQVAALVTVLGSAVRAFGETADKLEKNEIQPADAMREVMAALRRAGEAAPPGGPDDAGAANQESQADASAAEASGSAASPRRPNETLSGRNVNTDTPTLEETLGRQ